MTENSQRSRNEKEPYAARIYSETERVKRASVTASLQEQIITFKIECNSRGNKRTHKIGVKVKNLLHKYNPLDIS